MASVTGQTQNVPKVVLKKLLRMRSKLTRWILVHGVGRWLMVVLAILAVDMLLDRMFKMDFAQRMVMLVVMAVATAVFFGWRVIKPLLSRPNDDALIYEIESKNPELNQSLISGVQLAREKDFEAMGLSPSLTEATIQRGMTAAESIDFENSLDLSRHFQNWMLLLCGLVLFGLIGWGVIQTEFLRTWYNRNILLLDDQWPQATYLEIVGATDGKLILPRGNDHRQIVNVTEDSTDKNVVVSLEVDNPGGRTIHQMKPTGKLQGLEHVFMFHNVSSTFRFRASGGDAVTGWVDVELVEPPSIIELKLAALLPNYTGIDSLELSGVGPHSVLAGSRLQVEIKTNKAVSAAKLKVGEEVYSLNKLGDDTRLGLTIPVERELIGGEYQFELADTTGLPSSRASKFKLTIKPDDTPKVRASLLGISGLVSSRAILPTSYQAADQYGLVQLFFDSSWKSGVDEAQPGKREFVFLEPGLTDGVPTTQVKDYATLDLLPLKLQPGTSFRFSVAAKDNHPGVPKIGRSQEFLLRVVSDDELRADLLRREIEQRKAFDQAYQSQLVLASELEAIALRRIEDGTAKDDFDSQRESILIQLVQRQKGVGTAIDQVASRFEEFLVEVKNNRLDEAENEIAPDQRIETRFDERIIKPIRRLDQELVSLATRHVDNCRRAVRNEEELAIVVDQTMAVHQQILEEMKRILSAMNDSESFQEIINDILEVKQDAARIKSDIEDRLKPKDLFEDDDDIFEK